MTINLHLLRIFFTVAESRSFSRAAEALFISQPAVSKAVRELEHQLGLPLLERGTGGPKSARGVQLTPDGAAVFEHARGIFAMERAAVEEVQARVGLQRGRLRVGASTTIGGYWLPGPVAELARQRPGVELQVVTGNTRAICQALIDCRIDIGVVEGDVHDPRIAARAWREDPLCIVAPAGSALAAKVRPTPEALSRESWLQRELGSGTREVAERLMQQLGILPQRFIEFGSNEGIARAVAAGVGVAILPMRVVRELLALGEVAVLMPAGTAPPMRPLWMVELKDRPPSPLVKAFREVLAQAPED